MNLTANRAAEDASPGASPNAPQGASPAPQGAGDAGAGGAAPHPGQARGPGPSPRPWDGGLALAALAVIGGLLAIAPHDLLAKADWAGYAVCHQILDHTIFVAGRPLPLCARCTGMYLGALAGFVVLVARGRGRAGNLPARRHLLAMAAAILLWAVDGVNSYLTLFPVLPHLYEPHNWLRLATGTLVGLILSTVLLPVLNDVLWREPSPERSVMGWTDLAWLLVGGAGMAALVASQWAPLLAPLAVLSGLMVVGLVGSVNFAVVLALLRRAGRAVGGRRGWTFLAAPGLAAVALAMLELAAIAVGRALLSASLGLLLPR